MPDYEPAKEELASRDVVSRRIMQHIRDGYGVESPYGEHVWLDIRHLGAKHINTNLREIANICKNFRGIDPFNELIPVRPTQHYSMGGVRTNIDGQAYGLRSLFATGRSRLLGLTRIQPPWRKLAGQRRWWQGKLSVNQIARYTKEVSPDVKFVVD